MWLINKEQILMNNVWLTIPTGLIGDLGYWVPDCWFLDNMYIYWHARISVVWDMNSTLISIHGINIWLGVYILMHA